MKSVRVLGTGCPKCNLLAESVKRVAREMGIGIDFEKVDNMNRILEYGVMITPALVIDGEVKVTGKVPGDSEMKRLLQ